MAQQVRETLKGVLTARRSKDWEEAVPLFDVDRVMKQMFAKMRTSDKLAKAAIEWATHRMKKRRLSVERYCKFGST